MAPPLDFPSSPATGATYAGGNGVVYTYNGTVWLASGASAGGDFYATGTGGAVNTVADTTIIPTTVVSGNSTGSYSTSTGRYSPPAGRYNIFGWYSAGAGGTATAIYIYLYKNGTLLPNSYLAFNIGAGLSAGPSISAVVDANGTDYFELRGKALAASTFGGFGFGGYPISGIKGPPGDPTPGTLIQTVSYQTGAVATGTTVIPLDDTIPQITEGNEYMTLSVTPRSATSKLLITVSCNVSSSSAGQAICGALFQDSTANALAATYIYSPTATVAGQLTFHHTMTSGTTSATTFRVRIGSNGAGTTTFNGSSGVRQYGGVMASSIVIQEVAP